jgi:predicted flavoprotein YhiN
VTPSRSDLPTVILGAGAAGLTAALFAAGAGRRAVLLERTRDGGRKILVSGGGRCNILPSEAAPERFVTDSSPNTLRKILLSWPLAEQRRFFEEEAGVALALEAESG